MENCGTTTISGTEINVVNSAIATSGVEFAANCWPVTLVGNTITKAAGTLTNGILVDAGYPGPLLMSGNTSIATTNSLQLSSSDVDFHVVGNNFPEGILNNSSNGGSSDIIANYGVNQQVVRGVATVDCAARISASTGVSTGGFITHC